MYKIITKQTNLWVSKYIDNYKCFIINVEENRIYGLFFEEENRNRDKFFTVNFFSFTSEIKRKIIIIFLLLFNKRTKETIGQLFIKKIKTRTSKTSLLLLWEEEVFIC